MCAAQTAAETSSPPVLFTGSIQAGLVRHTMSVSISLTDPLQVMCISQPSKQSTLHLSLVPLIMAYMSRNNTEFRIVRDAAKWALRFILCSDYVCLRWASNQPRFPRCILRPQLITHVFRHCRQPEGHMTMSVMDIRCPLVYLTAVYSLPYWLSFSISNLVSPPYSQSAPPCLHKKFAKCTLYAPSF